MLGEAFAQLPADLLRAPALLDQLGDDPPETVVGLDPPSARTGSA